MRKCWHHLLYAKTISFFVKKSEKLVEVVNIDGENVHILWTTWGIFIKFSGKMLRMIIMTRNFSLNDTFLEKPQGDRIDPPPQSFTVYDTLLIQIYHCLCYPAIFLKSFKFDLNCMLKNRVPFHLKLTSEGN